MARGGRLFHAMDAEAALRFLIHEVEGYIDNQGCSTAARATRVERLRWAKDYARDQAAAAKEKGPESASTDLDER